MTAVVGDDMVALSLVSIEVPLIIIVIVLWGTSPSHHYFCTKFMAYTNINVYLSCLVKML